MNSRYDVEQIQAWMVEQIAERCDLAASEIDVRDSFESFGLSSRDGVILTGQLAEWMEEEISPTAVWEYPTIEALARHLAGADANTAESASAQGSQALDAPVAVDEQEPVAIVGMGCRFPGADGLEEFWQLLLEGRDAIREVPAERWDVEAYYNPEQDAPGKLTTRWGGFLNEIDRFDAEFFGIVPREAVAMDPQQRLLMETSWEALEDAGQVPHELAGQRVGVFIGISNNDYARLTVRDTRAIDAYTGTGAAASIAANRLSFYYDFKGPSIAVDTACSSSLVAMHLAAKSLRSGESSLALAGGVNLILSPAVTINFSKAGAMSPDGRCKTFDERANGTVRSEGVGVVVLKRLSDALRDGDAIYAVVRGSALSQDGRTNGLMAPSPQAQEMVLREAYRDANVSPGEIDYVETHGTGTLLGDSIEAQSLGAVLGDGRAEGGRCLLGSVKTNIGHPESAAGIAGVIKVALAMKYGTIPQNLHFENPNPYIPFDRLPLRVVDKQMPWPQTGKPKLAAVSGFGFGGTNAHVVLEEAPATQGDRTEPVSGDVLLPLSAKSEDAIRALAAAYAERLTSTDDALVDIASAAALRRTHHEHRIAVHGANRQELADKLSAFAAGEMRPGMAQGRALAKPKLAFVFPGQGSQWLGMGRELLETEAVFRQSLEEIEQAMRGEVDWSLLEQVRGEGESLLERIDVIQPTLFAIQVSLVKLWASWGIVPDAVIGHSMGEVAAAHAAGILSLRDAVKVICSRSRLLRRLSGQGAMAIVELTLEEAKEALRGYEEQVSVAVSNSRRSTVIAGNPEAVADILALLEARDVFCRLVKADVAGHSPQLDPLKPELLHELQGLQPEKTLVPFYSTVSEQPRFDAHYWVNNLREPVRFLQAMERLLADGYTLFVEMSPHPILLPAVKETMQESGRAGAVLPSMRRQEAERNVLLDTFGHLYAFGYPVNWSLLYPQRSIVPLPTYAWQRQTYWVNGAEFAAIESGSIGVRELHPLLGVRVDVAASGSRLWQQELTVADIAYLEDYQLGGMPLLPASMFVEIAAAAARKSEPARGLADVKFLQPMLLGEPRAIQLFADGEMIKIASRRTDAEEEAWTLHLTAALTPLTEAVDHADAALAVLQERLRSSQTADALYQRLEERGLHYGDGLRTIRSLWLEGGEALAELSLAETQQRQAERYGLHPALLDVCFQLPTLLAAEKDGLYLPTALDSVKVFADLGAQAWAHVQRKAADNDNEAVVDADLYREDGTLVAQLVGLRYRALNGAAVLTADEIVYEVQWQEYSVEEAGDPVLPSTGNWLIYADRHGVGAALAQRLEAQGQRAALVDFGTGEQDVQADCCGVIDLWSLDISRPESLGDLADGQARGAEHVVRLVQHMASRSWTTAPRLWIVTQGAKALQGSPVRPEQAPVWGLGEVIAAEHDKMWGGLVDLEPGADVEAAADQIMRAITSASGEDQWCFRHDQAFVPRLVRSVAQQAPLSWRTDGSYLITGGLDELGLAVAGWMAERGARRLILMGSTPLPPRREWSGLDPASQQGHQTAAVRKLEAAGLQVHLAFCDASDEAALADFLDTYIAEGWPSIRGIIHAAGVIEDRTLLEQDDAAWNKVMRPKMQAAWNLHRRFAPGELDFFCLFSSMAALVGFPGQASYAIANAFLDALAAERRQAGDRRAVSVNWPVWDGLGFDTLTAGQRLPGLMKQIGLPQLKREHGLEAFGFALDAVQPNIAVLTGGINAWRRMEPVRRLPMLFHGGEQEAQPQETADRRALADHARSLVQGAERKAWLMPFLQEQAAQVMRLPIAQLPFDKEFGEMGMDSIMAMEIGRRLQAGLDLSLSATLMFYYPTIFALAEYLDEQLGGGEQEALQQELHAGRAEAAAGVGAR